MCKKVNMAVIIKEKRAGRQKCVRNLEMYD